MRPFGEPVDWADRASLVLNLPSQRPKTTALRDDRLSGVVPPQRCALISVPGGDLRLAPLGRIDRRVVVVVRGSASSAGVTGSIRSSK